MAQDSTEEVLLSRGTTFLMYHELERPNRPLCRSDQGYRRYVISEDAFSEHLEILADEGFRCVATGAAIESLGDPGVVCLTVDDGCETDYVAMAPALARNGFSATFYVTVDWIDRPGYLSVEQMRELGRTGFEIGCHSMTHAYLPMLGESALAAEVVDAKARLEDVLGSRIDHFSCPGGRWDRRVARVIREAGFVTCATSRVGVNRRGADPYRLARVAIQSSTSPEQVVRFAQGRGMTVAKLKGRSLDVAKNVLGDERYGRWRARLLPRRDR